MELASDWRWSSAAARLGRGDSTGLVDLANGLAAEFLTALIRKSTG